MSKPLLLFLLAVFTIHLVVFLRLAVRHRKSHHILGVVTFVLLLVSTGLQLLWPEARLGNLPIHGYFRYTAWLTSAGLVIAYVRHIYRHRAER